MALLRCGCFVDIEKMSESGSSWRPKSKRSANKVGRAVGAHSEKVNYSCRAVICLVPISLMAKVQLAKLSQSTTPLHHCIITAALTLTSITCHVPLLMGASAKNSPAAAFVRVRKNPGSHAMFMGTSTAAKEHLSRMGQCFHSMVQLLDTLIQRARLNYNRPTSTRN